MKDKITFMTEMEEIKNTFFDACDKLFDEAKKEQETEGVRVLKKEVRFFQYSSFSGVHWRSLDVHSTTHKRNILNKQAFFTEEEAELYAEVHERLLLACCDESNIKEEHHYLKLITGNVIIGHLDGCKFLDTYQTNDRENLEKAIEEIGQEKLKAFFNLKPIIPSEVEGWEW